MEKYMNDTIEIKEEFHEEEIFKSSDFQTEQSYSKSSNVKSTSNLNANMSIRHSKRVRKKSQKMISMDENCLKKYLKKDKNVETQKSRDLIRIKNVFVSVAQLKPPYCVSCDKYYCSENELKYHINFEHIKGYIEFMPWVQFHKLLIYIF